MPATTSSHERGHASEHSRGRGHAAAFVFGTAVLVASALDEGGAGRPVGEPTTLAGAMR